MERTMPILTLVFGRDVLGTYEIEEGRLIIGRADDCDITIDNLAVSRHHAIIEKNEDSYTIKDLDSNNGTFVNGHRVGTATTLNFGDEIGVGKHVLVFDSHSKKSRISAAAGSGVTPDMDMPDRGTMFVEPSKMEKIQERSTFARKAHLLPKNVPNAKMMMLEKSDVVFGRAPECDIKITGFFASRRHAILSRLEKGYQVTNLAVFSPTRVNGIRIESALLCDGDEIRMGKSAFVFHSEQ
jgi:pSer/pThr/pTyr-binding forkhead associated (FHA) protein